MGSFHVIVSRKYFLLRNTPFESSNLVDYIGKEHVNTQGVCDAEKCVPWSCVSVYGDHVFSKNGVNAAASIRHPSLRNLVGLNFFIK